jgi:hypothetical protein
MRPGVTVIARPVIYAAVSRSSRNCHHARAPSAAALVTFAGLAAVAASALAVPVGVVGFKVRVHIPERHAKVSG